MELQKFNVIEYNHNKGKAEYYDVLPYFRRCWESKTHNFDRDSVTSKSDLKDWIKRTSQYQFWSRCEYEFVIGSWPFGSYNMKEQVRAVINRDDFNLDDYGSSIDFYNAILSDMCKIDVHEQIMMNIDVVTNILANEFKVL